MFRKATTHPTLISLALVIAPTAWGQALNEEGQANAEKPATEEGETTSEASKAAISDSETPEPNSEESSEESEGAPERESTAGATVDAGERAEATSDDGGSSNIQGGQGGENRPAAIDGAAPNEPTAVEDETKPGAPVEAAAAPSEPFQFSGSFWSRFEWRENYDQLGVSRPRFFEGDQTVFRARLGMRSAPIALTEGLEGLVQFTPQASGSYGVDGTVQEHDLGIYEGYFRIAGSAASVDVGRFMMDYGEALVIGNLDWHQTARAFDGVRAQIGLGPASLDIFVTQANAAGAPGAEGHPVLSGSLFAGDYYFYGAYAQLGALLDEDFDWDLYALGNSNVRTDNVPNPADPTDPTLPTVTIAGSTMVTTGTRVKHAVGILDYRLEGGLQFGERPAVEDAVSHLAYQVDGEVGVKPIKKLRVALAGALASGDDLTTPESEGWAPLYATHHKWFGLMDVAGLRTNIGSGALKLSAQATDSLTAKVDAHVFARPKNGGLAQVGEDKLAGYEIDAQLVQKIGKPATVRGLYGIFLPNEGYFGTSEAAHYVEVQAGLSF